MIFCCGTRRLDHDENQSVYPIASSARSRRWLRGAGAGPGDRGGCGFHSRYYLFPGIFKMLDVGFRMPLVGRWDGSLIEAVEIAAEIVWQVPNPVMRSLRKQYAEQPGQL